MGTIDDKSLLQGLMKLAGLGGTPNLLGKPGEEKSSISSFRMIPVDFEANPAPITYEVALYLVVSGFSVLSLDDQ